MIDLLVAAGVFDAPMLILSKTKSTLFVLFAEDRRRFVLFGAVIVCDVRRAVDIIYYIGVAISTYQGGQRSLDINCKMT